MRQAGCKPGHLSTLAAVPWAKEPEVSEQAWEYHESFSERMQRGRDEATRHAERFAYAAARVSYKRPPLTIWRTVAEVAAAFGVGEAQVRQVLRRGGIKGARQKRVGRSLCWFIPAKRQADGSYRVTVNPGARGPRAAYALSRGEEPPF